MSRKLKSNNVIFSVVTAILISLYAMLLTSNSHAAKNTSLDNAVTEIRNQTNGKIISADTVTVDNTLKHRIKVLMPNGHVKVFYKPAN
ncbi:MAG: hypothetical protein ACC653_00260 [Gammaproteobacteria bacterium]